ncbi:major histocompatibility complex class I-related gene protein-like isoform X2 [Dendrobates tinctorius]|uniref:major histocompatibility complex class I-related gene protein-like isoform X2 n=1 Tax=Dendrobates tinctorius TaxID=92724 RepID=UPI003CC99E62
MYKMSALSLILLAVSGVYSDSHSLRYYFTGVSAPGYGLPEFSKVGYVDDQQIDVYSSDNRRSIPLAPWLKKNERPEHWETVTDIAKEHETLFRDEVKIGMKRFNHTGGFHLVQVMHHCELRDDGSVIGKQQYRYDGREFMYLDVEKATYYPIMAEAQITTQRWNSEDVKMGEIAKNYLERICVTNLKRYIMYGKEDLERRVQPGVKVTHWESGKVTKLHCQVYGFHPRAVDVKWMKNKDNEIPPFETTNVLPNPDGTYQIRVSAEVTPKDGDRYSCYVDHSSLREPLLVQWEPPHGFPWLWILSLVMFIIILVVASVFARALLSKKKKEKYKAASMSDAPRETSYEVSEES